MNQQYSIAWLKEQVESGLPIKFIFFWGHTNQFNEELGKFCFSQWFVAPFTADGIVYPTAEHWMMAQKALLFNDQEAYHKIIAAQKPGEAKDLGRTVRNFDETLWNAKRYEIVVQGNIHKFTQHLAMAEYLIGTGDRILVEASPVDAIWGVGLAADSNKIKDVDAWRGLNLLGFALMEVRDYLKTKINQ